MTAQPPAEARSIAGTAVLVAGGAGFLGRVITRGLLDDGALVVVPSRNPLRLAALSQDADGRPGTLVPVRLTDAGPREAAPRIAEVAPGLRAVVAAIGGFAIGPALIDLPEDTWQTALADHLTSHLIAMQAYVPLLLGSHDPVYVAMNGAAGYQPMAGSGAISVTGAAQRMLVDVMRVEPIGSLVRFHEIAVMAAVGGDDRNLTPAEEADPAKVVAAVRSVLLDPGAAPVAVVGGRT
jgi:NAD(P)-dependent dehydrogenase (short-subunit alcohol dehydrogenase family)